MIVCKYLKCELRKINIPYVTRSSPFNRSTKNLAGHEGEVNGASISWCGHYLASWATDASANVWDLRQDHHPLYTLCHDAEVRDLTPCSLFPSYVPFP